LIAWVAMGCSSRALRYPGGGGGRAAESRGGAGGAPVLTGAGGTGGDAGVTGAGGSVIDAGAAVDSVAAADTSTAADAATLAVARARFLFIFYSPHGTVLDLWRPSGSGGTFTLSRILSPLEAYRDRVTVIDGLDNVSAPGQPTSTHVDGPRMLLTARATGGPSIDYLFLKPGARSQVVAGTDVSARDLMLESSSTAAFTNYDPSQGAPLLPIARPRDLAVSFSPDQITLAGDPDPANMIETMQAFVSIATQATSHDDTRSITLMWGLIDGTLPLPLSSLTVNQMAEASDTSWGSNVFVQEQVTIAEQVAALVASLDQTPVAPGVTMLDRSLVMWISETGEASSHSGHNIPVVLIGNLGGALRQGQYLRYVNRTQGDLMLTLARVTGATTFGDPAIATAPLTELLAP
jgi:hypothetical protein